MPPSTARHGRDRSQRGRGRADRGRAPGRVRVPRRDGAPRTWISPDLRRPPFDATSISPGEMALLYNSQRTATVTRWSWDPPASNSPRISVDTRHQDQLPDTESSDDLLHLFCSASIAAFFPLKMEKIDFVGFSSPASLEKPPEQVCDTLTCLSRPPQVTLSSESHHGSFRW